MLVRLFVLSAFAFVLVGIAGAGPAFAQKPACTLVDSLPYTIKEPGHYCLPGGILGVTMASGSAIEIAADGVDLDLNDTVIDNTGAGANTAVAIHTSSDLINVSIHGGTLRGFFNGVNFQAGRVRNGVIENVRVERSAHYAIAVDGWDIAIRHNFVTNTGSQDSVQAVGIFGMGPGLRIIDNDISETLPGAQSAAYGIVISSKQGSATAAVVENNRISNTSLAASTYGAIVSSSASAMLVGNRIMSMTTGLLVNAGSSAKYRDNLALGCTTAYSGVTNVGNNN